MKTTTTKTKRAPVARLSLRRHKHSPAGQIYRGLLVTVPSLNLRAKFTGAGPRSDYAEALKLCKKVGWRVELTEAVKRALPGAKPSASRPGNQNAANASPN